MYTFFKLPAFDGKSFGVDGVETLDDLDSEDRIAAAIEASAKMLFRFEFW